MDPAILQLPAAIQLTLASGYAAYLVAYRGIREHHKAIDTAFFALTFSLLATVIALVFDNAPRLAAISFTFILTVLSGVLWRTIGMRLVAWVSRSTDHSWADETPSAWARLIGNTNHRISQISVVTDDGATLRCDDTRLFADSPFGPCVLGTNGDLVIYLTHRSEGSSAATRVASTQDDEWGDRLTYIPAARIRRVSMRFLPSRRKTVGPASISDPSLAVSAEQSHLPKTDHAAAP